LWHSTATFFFPTPGSHLIADAGSVLISTSGDYSREWRNTLSFIGTSLPGDNRENSGKKYQIEIIDNHDQRPYDNPDNAQGIFFIHGPDPEDDSKGTKYIRQDKTGCHAKNDA
jgi:hypothetical protein